MVWHEAAQSQAGAPPLWRFQLVLTLGSLRAHSDQFAVGAETVGKAVKVCR